MGLPRAAPGRHPLGEAAGAVGEAGPADAMQQRAARAGWGTARQHPLGPRPAPGAHPLYKRGRPTGPPAGSPAQPPPWVRLPCTLRRRQARAPSRPPPTLHPRLAWCCTSQPAPTQGPPGAHAAPPPRPHPEGALDRRPTKGSARDTGGERAPV